MARGWKLVVGVGLSVAVLASCGGGSTKPVGSVPVSGTPGVRVTTTPLPDEHPIHWKLDGRIRHGCVVGSATLSLGEFSWPSKLCLSPTAMLDISLAPPGAGGQWSTPRLSSGGAIKVLGQSRTADAVDERLLAVSVGRETFEASTHRREGSEGTISIVIRVASEG